MQTLFRQAVFAVLAYLTALIGTGLGLVALTFSVLGAPAAVVAAFLLRPFVHSGLERVWYAVGGWLRLRAAPFPEEA